MCVAPILKRTNEGNLSAELTITIITVMIILRSSQRKK